MRRLAFCRHGLPVGFNPRTRVGCDYSCNASAPLNPRFNPRTRVGCDQLMPLLFVRPMVSIHAPVWGATYIVTTEKRIIGFQSTHPCGVRQDLSGHVKCASQVSIHAPVWGATTFFSLYCSCVGVSIHAPVWGATMISSRALAI